MSTTHLLPFSNPRKGRHLTITRMADPRALSSSDSSPWANPSCVWTGTTAELAGVLGAVSTVLVVAAGDMGGRRGGLTALGLLGDVGCASVDPAFGGMVIYYVLTLVVDWLVYLFIFG
jgi:hypothetical protein